MVRPSPSRTTTLNSESFGRSRVMAGGSTWPVASTFSMLLRPICARQNSVP